MHSKNIIHRNLNPESIMYDPSNKRLIFKDLTKAIDLDLQTSSMVNDGYIGSHYYNSPELLNK